MKRIILNLFFAVLVMTVGFVLFGGKAHAIIINEGQYGWPATIPDRFYYHASGSIFTPINYFCYSPSEDLTFPGSMSTWISLKDQPRQETVTIIAGMTDSVDMQINVVGNHCTLNMDTGAPPQLSSKLINRNYIKRTSNYITSINSSPGTSITNVSLPQLQTLNWDNTKNSSNPSNDLFYVKKPNGQPEAFSFTLSGIADLPPGDHYISVNAGGRAVNEWGPENPYSPDAPQFSCVSPPRQQALNIEGTNEPFGPNCSESGTGFTFYLQVRSPDPDATFHVSKYEPPSHPADGNFSNVDNEVNDARMCIRNKSGNEFACNTQVGAVNSYRKNGWNKGGIWDHPDHDPYAVVVDVPEGWQVTNARINGADRAFTCTNNANKTGRCETSIDAVAGTLSYIDFWYQRISTDGTIYVSKYEPPSHPANGNFFNVDNVINDARVCIQNSGGNEFACNTEANANNAYRRNGWRKGGIWALPAPNNPYRVWVDVPVGWKVTGTNIGAATCQGNNSAGTERCYVTQTVVDRGFHYVDFWFDTITPRTPMASIYVSKYEPPSHPADGNFASVNNVVNDARACMKNASGSEFACNDEPGASNVYRENGWLKDNIWALDGHRPYNVLVDVPNGWRVTGAKVNGADKTVECSDNVSKTGRCWLSDNPGDDDRIAVVEDGFYWVDFWYEQIPPTECSVIRYLDPLANNNELRNETPEAGQNVNVEFVAPVSLPAGATQFTIDSFSITPGAGLTGLSGSRTAAIGTPILVNGITSNSPQSYTFTYRVSWNGPAAGSRTCPGGVSFATKPYMRVYGNDVKVGGGLSPSCSPANPKATILTYAKESTTGDPNQFEEKGSGTQFAAFALGEVYQFITAGQNGSRTNTPAGGTKARPPLDLTFGNYDPANSIGTRDPSSSPGLYDKSKVEGYGGMSGMPGCIDNYYSIISTQAGSTNFVPNTMLTRTITTPTAEYHDGDLVITGNVALGGSWANAANGKTNIPSYYLVVRGNIYIESTSSGGVDRLDGVYIAQDDGTGTKGRIYTCSTGRALHTPINMYTNCNRRLTVNGAFVARQVKFLRSIDTLRNAAQDESAANTKAAEVFNFSPETYLAQPNAALKRGSQKVQYDFITSLPPIL